MSNPNGLALPDELDEWPHEARKFVLAESNTLEDLRIEMNALAGIPSDVASDPGDSSITKEEVAALILALGGPQDGP